ncbi:FecR family protein [Sphingobacterium sp. SYP-B4668]|uniref:FecR family protein n=1 Tax=Sphingobacterium sp. SYP-B4668 TaxID=2996035 RepID=UPI0022DD619B|nr:FecR domain-containing protein [Sphingobacterium sp. SYP-B4668]
MEKNKEKLRQLFDIREKDQLLEEEKQTLLADILRSGRTVHFRKRIVQLSVAAAIPLILTLSFYFFKSMSSPVDLQQIAQMHRGQMDHSDHIQLIQSENENSNKSRDGFHGRSDKSYTSDSVIYIANSDNKSQFTTIYVPYGKRQEVTLVDGTKVWLNAGSFLTMANNLGEGERRVFLNGEAYFDVAHTGTPFYVEMRENAVHVMGTSFNINNYDDNRATVVELISGSILLKDNADRFEKIKMEPGQRVTVERATAQVKMERSGGGQDILWREKQLVLDRLPLSDLFKKLERFYNIRIQAPPQLAHVQLSYSGRLDLRDDVVSIINDIYELRDYQIELKEKEVIIRKK